MLTHVRIALQERCGLSGQPRIVVGVSGGPDSLCLLDVLVRLGYPVSVAHLDHGLRPGSAEDARFVGKLSEALGLPFISERVDVRAVAQSRGGSLEEVARELRYEFLSRAAKEQASKLIAVGHTANDQVETVLMHLLRGAGLSGLAGMRARAPLPYADGELELIRPLLAIWRDQVLAYCQATKLQPRFDESNLDATLYRNRLRMELIPYLRTYNNRLPEIILRMAEVLAGDLEIVEQGVAAAWERCLADQGPGYLAFELQQWEAEPLGLRRSLLRQGIGLLRPALRDIGFDSVQRAVQAVKNPPRTGRTDLLAGLRLEWEGGRIWLVDPELGRPPGNWPQYGGQAVIISPAPGSFDLGRGWAIELERVTRPTGGWGDRLKDVDPLEAWLALPESDGPLTLRTRRPGDRFQPLGMQGRSMKLADFMINVKMPRRARDRWPLICYDDQIAWIPGYRIADPYRLAADTPQAIYLRCRRL